MNSTENLPAPPRTRFVADRETPEGTVRKVWRRVAGGFAEVEPTGAASLFAWSPAAGGAGYSYGPDSGETKLWRSGPLEATIPNTVSRMAELPGGGLIAVRAGWSETHEAPGGARAGMDCSEETQ